MTDEFDDRDEIESRDIGAAEVASFAFGAVGTAIIVVILLCIIGAITGCSDEPIRVEVKHTHEVNLNKDPNSGPLIQGSIFNRDRRPPGPERPRLLNRGGAS